MLTRKADLIIGADGIRSVVRTNILGSEVKPKATGLSAYRMMIPASSISSDIEISKFLNPNDSCKTMVMGHSCRLIMGPARNASIYSIVALVPDGKQIFIVTKRASLTWYRKNHGRYSKYFVDKPGRLIQSSREF